jgi:hypothetical protein
LSRVVEVMLVPGSPTGGSRRSAHILQVGLAAMASASHSPREAHRRAARLPVCAQEHTPDSEQEVGGGMQNQQWSKRSCTLHICWAV